MMAKTAKDVIGMEREQKVAGMIDREEVIPGSYR